MKDIDESGYTYLGIAEIDNVKEKKTIEKFIQEDLQHLWLTLKSKLNKRDKIITIKGYRNGILKN